MMFPVLLLVATIAFLLCMFTPNALITAKRDSGVMHARHPASQPHQRTPQANDRAIFYAVIHRAYDQEHRRNIEREQLVNVRPIFQPSPIFSTKDTFTQRARQLIYTPQAHDIYPSWHAKQVYPNDLKSRVLLRHELAILTNNYRKRIPTYGLNPHMISDAAAFYILAAYRVFNGDRYSDTMSSRIGTTTILHALTRNPKVLALNQEDLQFITERYAVRGQILMLLHADAVKRRDRAALHALHVDARLSLQQELGVDPAKLRLDTIACLEKHPYSCERYISFLRGIYARVAHR